MNTEEKLDDLIKWSYIISERSENVYDKLEMQLSAARFEKAKQFKDQWIMKFVVCITHWLCMKVVRDINEKTN